MTCFQKNDVIYQYYYFAIILHYILPQCQMVVNWLFPKRIKLKARLSKCYNFHCHNDFGNVGIIPRSCHYLNLISQLYIGLDNAQNVYHSGQLLWYVKMQCFKTLVGSNKLICLTFSLKAIIGQIKVYRTLSYQYQTSMQFCTVLILGMPHYLVLYCVDTIIGWCQYGVQY